MTTARIRRVHGPTRYENVPHSLLQDERLSFRARGVLAYLLSLPDDFETSAERIARKTPGEGRDAIRTALRELETAGYLHRRRVQVELGRWCTEWLYGDDPVAVAQRVTGGELSTGDELAEPVKPQVRPKTDFQSSVSRTSVGQSSKKLRTDKTSLPPPSQTAPSAPAEPVVVEVSGGAETDEVRAVLEPVCGAWGIGARSRARLRGRVAQALEDGHDPAGLVRHLNREPLGNGVGALLYRLDDAPSPAAARPRVAPQCGECSPNRWLEDEAGRPVRKCPRCHPDHTRRVVAATSASPARGGGDLATVGDVVGGLRLGGAA